jgi:hypothetical protein
MAWTANKDREDTDFLYIVLTEAGNPASPQTLHIRKPVTLAGVQTLVRDWIADHSDTGIPSGVVTPAAPPTPPTPDPDATLRQQFLDALQAIRQLDKAIALPITTGATLTALNTSRTSQLSALQTFYNSQTVGVRQKIVDAI